MQTISQVLKNLNILELNPAYSTGAVWGSPSAQMPLTAILPLTAKKIASVQVASVADYEEVIKKTGDAFVLLAQYAGSKTRGETCPPVWVTRCAGTKLTWALWFPYEMGKELFRKAWGKYRK